jgi:hypothetical protein
MVRPNRLKDYTFQGAELKSNAAGLFKIYSNNPINGVIQKVEYIKNNYTANGSLYIEISGTNELIWRQEGSLDSNAFAYPFAYSTNSNNTTGSPQIGAQFVVNNNISLVGSGVGNITSGTRISVYYI